ncbi:TonB-dependent receptor [Solitalea longa]|uniref:TonB-dependent receptor n=1 Tax=Solitalea longa TaxID=2079460 RepID=A0A2S5A9N7_9SPHI|nr:TonB-dependent receptor [Solitalea longa]POY38967.1 TonB-dependent receptor [Solitalea longa]
MQKIKRISASYGLILGRSTLLLSLILVTFLGPLAASAQVQTKPIINSTLTGTVINSRTKSPVEGAVVHINGTTHEVVTDREGKFNFVTGQKFPYTLFVSLIGYKKKEIVANGSPVNIELEESVSQLDEIVVVGYATQERRNLVSSVSKVSATETKNLPVAGFNEQLQGKAAGVQINSNAGIPGDGIFVRVRGTTSINASSDPLYIVDGVFINNTSLQTLNTGGRATSPIADINPADIENIEVLKDATATAIYGARGANGVIIVTTKRGNFNTKARVSFNINQGVASAIKLWDLESAEANAEVMNVAWINTGIDKPSTNQTFANRPFRPVSEGGKGLPSEQQDYDRLNDLYRTASLSNYDFSLQGGTSATRYYFGLSYTDQESIMRPVYFTRGSFKANLDQKVNSFISVGMSNSLSRSFRNQATAGDGPTGNMMVSTLNSATYLAKNAADGTPIRWNGWDNLQQLLDNYNTNTKSLRYIGNLYADAEIIPGLKFRTSASVDYDNYNESQYWNTNTVQGSAPTNGRATSGLSDNTTWINEQTLTFRHRFGTKHNFGALIGNTLQSNIRQRTSAVGTGFANNSFELISSAANTTSSQAWTKGNLASFFSRLDYNYAYKYYIEVDARADGASNFGKNNQWGYFPSIGLAWRLKEEEFLKNNSVISDLKLRASAGYTGNQAGIDNFASQGLWTGGASYFDVAGTAPQQLGNPDLKWEKTRQIDAGVELGLFNDRINLQVDLYDKYTSDLLLSLPVPAVTGFNTYLTNLGAMSNKGYELTIVTNNIRKPGFSWQTSFNISGNINKIEKLPAPITVYSRDWVRMQEGSSMYSFWLYKQLSVDPANGDAIFEDVNKDGSITVADRQILGSATPKFYGGFNNSLNYRGFDANVFFSYSYGNDVYNLNRFFAAESGTRPDRSVQSIDKNYWTTPGQITNVPRPTSVGNNYLIEQNSRMLEDGSFIRLKSLTLGYTLPKKLTSRFKVESLRFYAVGSNLLLFTKYSGADPETNVTSNQNAQGLDYGTPPQPRTIQFGLNLTL